MIHQYKSNGYDIVMDVNSGAVHVVDDVTYDVISLYEELDSDSIVEKLKDTYDTNDILEAIEEVDNCLRKIYISLLLKNSKSHARQ